MYVFYTTVILSCIFSFAVNAQEQDSTETDYSIKDIQLKDAPSITEQYTYDPLLNRYVYDKSIGEVPVNFPLFLTPEEFRERVLREQMQAYFNEKTKAVDGRDKENQKDLIPTLYVNNTFFETIFGGNTIDITPQGSVSVDLGVLFSKQDNPSLSPRNQSNTSLDFDQQINLSIDGKVGERLDVSAQFDTQSTFDFQNQIKLDYTPTEDDILRKIEVGNVNMPLNSSLIQGAQSLFGVKTQFQFGKTKITGVFSELNSERNNVTAQGESTIQDFDKFILDYDENRHFFLSQYFRDQYNDALKNYPFINSNIQITRIQVWVTNRNNNTQSVQNARNIVALQDLGESQPENVGLYLDDDGEPISPPIPGFINNLDALPDNSNNDFNPQAISGAGSTILTEAIRDIASINQGFGSASNFVDEGIDYGKLENARELSPNQYTLNEELGYITLNQRLSNDEILGVAFQYTSNGQVYQVGEFANDGVNANQTVDDPNTQPGEEAQQIPLSQNLIVKMIKSPIVSVNEPAWDLMMKNFYSLDASQLEKEGFRLNILYSDPQPVNYITQAPGSTEPLPDDVADNNLLQVFELDQLNINNDPIQSGDGFFDFVNGITVDQDNGLIKFTKVEPFGEFLFNKLDNDPDTGPEDYDELNSYNENQSKYVYRSLYATTKIQASQIGADKNKFQLKGRYKASSQDGIPIGSFNVPRGSVTVTAGGRTLQEGVDYVVNYELGLVKIINEALKASDTPINVSTENNALFGQQTKRFTGIDVQHQFSEELLLGGTFLNLNERPITQKADFGSEPINNTMYGFNFNYNTEVPFLTRIVNKLPNIETEVASNFSLRGEFAYLQPGSPRGDNFQNTTTSFVDDFEGSQTKISMLNPDPWKLSSVPIGFRGPNDQNGNFDANNDLSINDYRAQLNWHAIDPIFYSSQRPEDITDEDVSDWRARRVLINELFPNTDLVPGQLQTIFTLDLDYRPDQRGMYNYNPAATDNTLPNPDDNFGGIMRGMQTTNFERANVEFVEFWVMDPFVYPENANNNGGKLVLNFGSMSEDILKDGRKQYENGLPENGGTANTIETEFAKIPANQSLVYAFDTEGDERVNQDVGYDGLINKAEAEKFPAFANLEDPSNDDYEFYLNKQGSILEKYEKFNGTEGNNPVEVTEDFRGNSPFPDVEDVNRDNTMTTIDSYFEYEVPIYPGMSVDNNTSNIAGIVEDYISDVREQTVTTQTGDQLNVRWVQFRVPLSTDSEFSKGGIADLRSIRFMRMYMTEFQQETVLRLGSLDLVRGDYITYDQPILPEGNDPGIGSTTFNVEAVSEEVTTNYVTPPGVRREEFINNNTSVRNDEQSLALTVKRLQPDDSRGVFKNYLVDMRQYKTLDMFIHAQALPPPDAGLEDDELVAFIRMGLDFTDNFYQIEVPLKVSDIDAAAPREIWPVENDLSLPLELLQNVKAEVLANQNISNLELNFFDEDVNPTPESQPGELRVGIKGNPSFGDVRVIMLGLKNRSGQEVSGEVWFNELRLKELINQGGWASILNLDTNIADFANITASASRNTIGFGSIEQGPNQRSREDSQQYSVNTGINVGQLLPTDWGVKIPFNYERGEELITPQFDPVFVDLELDNADDLLVERAENYTKRQSLSIIGLRKERMNNERTPLPIDIENFTFSGNYNQVNHRDFQISESLEQNVDVSANYQYNLPDLSIEPFKEVNFLDKSDYFKIFKDFNINPLPTSINVNSSITRDYSELRFREFNLTDGSLPLPKLYQRNFFFDWDFAIDYNLTQSLNFNFQASNNRIVRNFIDENNVQDNTIGVWDDFFNVGIANRHLQTLQLNYTLPINKIPAFEFIQAQYSFTGDFQWQKGSEIRKNLENIPDVGNTVQNSSNHQINATLSMPTLYNYIGLTKKTGNSNNQSQSQRKTNDARGDRRRGNVRQSTAGSNSQNTDNDNLSFGDKLFNVGVDLLGMVKQIQGNYSRNNGIFMPGYVNDIGFIGTLKPTTGFTFGLQEDIRQIAATNGWLTRFQQFNEQYSSTENEQFDFQATIRPVKGLTIDLRGNRIYSETYTENYQVNPETLEYQSLTPNIFGNFSISTNMIRTAFNSSSRANSENFDTFRANRLVVANRLAAEAGINLNNPDNVDENGFPVGFGSTNQAVLIPSFLSAYTDEDPTQVNLSTFRDIPIPNWDVKYTGLMQLDWFKDQFTRFSIEHGYQSTYTINQFQSNLDYNRTNPFDPFNRDQNGDFLNELVINNINLVEQFNPLVSVDFEMKNSLSILAEMKKDRTLSLSFNNNVLTEMQGQEYTLGLGYRVKDVKVVTRFEGRRRVLSSDLNFQVDVSLRSNQTILRSLDVQNNRVTSGQDIWNINFTTGYAFTKNFEVLFFYNHIFSQNDISTIFPQTTIRSGLTFTYNFGN
jgi:cell surface protein SprA